MGHNGPCFYPVGSTVKPGTWPCNDRGECPGPGRLELRSTSRNSRTPNGGWRMADGERRTPRSHRLPASSSQRPAPSSQRPAEELMRPVFGRSITTVMWSRDDVGRIDDPIFRRTYRAHSPLPGCRVSQEDRRPITASWSLEAGRWLLEAGGWWLFGCSDSKLEAELHKPNPHAVPPPPSLPSAPSSPSPPPPIAPASDAIPPASP